MSCIVREYRSADRAALDALYDDFFPKRGAQGLPPESADARRAWLERVLAHGAHVVAEVDGRLLAHAMLLPIAGQEDAAELANFVHQSARGRGIGTKLNRLILEHAKAHGYTRVWLSVEPGNRAAVRSYEKAGFSKLPGSLWAPEIEMEVVL